jgi:quercetin dioxygenase-like cupin family protein
VRSWNLNEIETPGGSRSPAVLDSDDAARVVLIGLDPGQELGEHQVKEHAFVLVVDGKVRVEHGGEIVHAPAGTLFTFEPDERRAVSTDEGARILLFLAPWPGPGHYRGVGQGSQAAGS